MKKDFLNEKSPKMNAACVGHSKIYVSEKGERGNQQNDKFAIQTNLQNLVNVGTLIAV